VAASNGRYLAFLAALDDPRVGLEKLHRVSRKAMEAGRGYRGIHFFDAEDVELLEVIAEGGFCVSGMQNKTLRERLPGRTTRQMSRTIQRLRTHGLIQKTARSYKYYWTPLGRRVIAAGLRLKEFVIRPELADEKVA
jgi:hypothetical protein